MGDLPGSPGAASILFHFSLYYSLYFSIENKREGEGE
jgi:hypothetical protein